MVFQEKEAHFPKGRFYQNAARAPMGASCPIRGKTRPKRRPPYRGKRKNRPAAVLQCFYKKPHKQHHPPAIQRDRGITADAQCCSMDQYLLFLQISITKQFFRSACSSNGSPLLRFSTNRICVSFRIQLALTYTLMLLKAGLERLVNLNCFPGLHNLWLHQTRMKTFLSRSLDSPLSSLCL